MKTSPEVVDAAQRARELTQRLLTLSRKRKVHLQPLNLNNLVNDLNKIIRVSLDERIKYVKELDDTVPYIQADKVSIEQVVVNLAINASHAMAQDGGCLTIQTHRVRFTDTDDIPEGLKAGDYVLMCLSDTGCGMSDESERESLRAIFHHQTRNWVQAWDCPRFMALSINWKAPFF